MKKFALIVATALAALPAHAAIVAPGAGQFPIPPATVDPFAVGTRGTLLAFSQTSGTAFTFATTFRSAVYRNTLGTLDFYYQVQRTGGGSTSSNPIQSFTAANFGNVIVDAMQDGSDFDGAGGFLVANNPGTFTATANRSFDGNVLGVNFGANNLVGTENSTTYIFRTNASRFTSGTFGVIDGSALQGPTFAPMVPEPATWAMMIGGFALTGLATRRGRRLRRALA